MRPYITPAMRKAHARTAGGERFHGEGDNSVLGTIHIQPILLPMTVPGKRVDEGTPLYSNTVFHPGVPGEHHALGTWHLQDTQRHIKWRLSPEYGSPPRRRAAPFREWTRIRRECVIYKCNCDVTVI